MEVKNIIDSLYKIYEAAPELLKDTKGEIRMNYYVLLDILEEDYKSIDIKIRRKVVVHYSDPINESLVQQALIKFLS